MSKLEKTVIGLVCLCMMMMTIKACQPDYDEEEEIIPVPPVSLREEPQEQPMGNGGYTAAPQSSGGIDAGDVALGIIAGQALRGNPTTPTYIPAPAYRSPMPKRAPVHKAVPTPQPKVRSHFVNPSKSSFGRSSFSRGSKR